MQILESAFGNEVFWNRSGEWRVVRALVRHHARRYIWMYVGLFFYLSFVGFVTYPVRAPGLDANALPLVLILVVFAVRIRNDGTAKTLLGLSFTRPAVAGSIWLSSVLLPPILFAITEFLGILVWVWGGQAAPFELLIVLPDTFVASVCCALFLMFLTAIPDPHLTLRDSYPDRIRYVGLFVVAFLIPIAVGATAIYLNHCFVKFERPFGILGPSWMFPVFVLEIALSLALVFTSALSPLKGLLEEPFIGRRNTAGPPRSREALAFQERPGMQFALHRFLRESLGQNETAFWAFLLLWFLAFLGFLTVSNTAYAEAIELYRVLIYDYR